MSVVLRFKAGGVMLVSVKFITNDKFFVLGLEKCSGVDASLVKMAKTNLGFTARLWLDNWEAHNFTC